MAKDDWYLQQIYKAFEEEEESTCVKPITPIHFLRDRELGIRGTSSRSVRQGVSIDNTLWSLLGVEYTNSLKLRVYGRALKDVCDTSCYKEADKDTKFQYCEKVFDKVMRHHALYITIPAGMGRRMELIVFNNYR